MFKSPGRRADIRYQSEIYEIIQNITRAHGLTSLVVTHDVNMASIYCDRISVLSRGKIVASGHPKEVLTEDLLTETYRFPVKVIKHPEEDTPVIIPVVR